jgi:hypothetical protein
MSLITAQGRQARAEVDLEITRLSGKIYESLADEPTVIHVLDTFSKNADEDVVREAMWRLLDRRQVELTGDRRLRRLDG